MYDSNVICPKCKQHTYLEYEYKFNDYWCTNCTVWRKQYYYQVVFKR